MIRTWALGLGRTLRRWLGFVRSTDDDLKKLGFVKSDGALTRYVFVDGTFEVRVMIGSTHFSVTTYDNLTLVNFMIRKHSDDLLISVARVGGPVLFSRIWDLLEPGGSRTDP